MNLSENTYDPRLPVGISPRRYQIELHPDIESATFTGRVVIDIECAQDTDEIVCNSADLEVTSVELHAADTTSHPRFRLDPKSERLHVETGQRIAPGTARLIIEFRGILNDKLKGFYRSTYVDHSGQEQVIATTQFQSTDARRAFPCWDEPAYKAVFESTLIIDPGLLAISNTAIVSDEIRADGLRHVQFAPTMVMSTYLVAFVVGPLEATEPVDVGGIPVRVIHRPGQSHLTSFALDVASHALEFYEDYYGVAYPSDKLDLLAIPDFAFGAMENLGCVTFREVLLLIDPDAASQPELQRVADVVNHEIAHMWFGDLVTMKWWEGIWLNEAFATFMEISCSDHYRPDWLVWTTFGRARAAAFNTDALANTRPIEYPVVSPEDAEAMFDILTYEKGASTVRMLEQYLGAEAFRDGVRHYLQTHAYSSTDTDDLWAALEETTGEPVGSIMQSWIFQGGYPLVSAQQTPHGLKLSQTHFTLDSEAADNRRWSVPLRVRMEGEHGPSIKNVLLDEESVQLTGTGCRLLSANAESAGFYRVRLPAEMLERLCSTGGQDLVAAERHAVVDDAWALTLAGLIDAATYLSVAESFSTDPDLTVWQSLSVGFSGLTRFVDPITEPTLRNRIAAAVQPMAYRLGTEPSEGDDDRTRELRATLTRLMGTVGDDPATISACRRLLDHDDPTTAAAALSVVSHHGDADDYRRVRSAWRGADNPQSEQRNLRSLADFPDVDLVTTTLNDTLNGQVRSQDGPYLIGRALTNRHAGTTAWAFIERNWESINDTFPSNSISRMLEGIVALDDPDDARRVRQFLTRHPIPQGEMQIAQHLESQQINVAARRREIERFSAWIAL